MKYIMIKPCASARAYELDVKKKIDMKMAADALSAIGEIVANTAAVLVVKTKEHVVSVYANGRILLKNTGKEEAEELGEKVLTLLEKGGEVGDKL